MDKGHRYVIAWQLNQLMPFKIHTYPLLTGWSILNELQINKSNAWIEGNVNNNWLPWD